MRLVTAPQLSERAGFGGFYVPRFEIEVASNNLPETVLADVIELSYQDNIEEIDGFEITVNNWDANTRTFKYIGSERAEDLEGNGEAAQRYRLFEPCDKRVAVRIGYGDTLELMMTGEVVTMEPSFPGSGPPTLTVQGLNQLHRLRTKQFTTAWAGRTPAQIAQNLSTLRDAGAPRFPLPIVVEEGPESRNQPIPYLAQDNQYDIDFLLNLARRYGYEVFIRERDGHEELYFGPSEDALPDETLSLVWGQSIIEFRPTVTTANQIKKVTVRGWDRRRREPIVAEIDVTDDDFEELNPDLARLITQCNPREEIVVDLPVFTMADAKAKAKALLLRRQQGLVEATVKTIGNPMVRAGTRLSISGVGARLSGTYFVDESKHTLGSGAYLTEFKAHRETEEDRNTLQGEAQ